MTDEQIFANLSDREILALTALGEARGDKTEGGSSIEERLAVMLTIRNRAAVPNRYGDGIKGVCLRRKQFSCWNLRDPNRAYLMRLAYGVVTGVRPLDATLEETAALADLVVSGTILDYTNGATHYYSPAAMVPKGSVPPWAVGKVPCARVGGHVFYKGV